jgi:hypothetical protein
MFNIAIILEFILEFSVNYMFIVILSEIDYLL